MYPFYFKYSYLFKILKKKFQQLQLHL